MNPENELDHLAVEHGSDKFGQHWYTPHYHYYFKELRDEEISLLEIGIGGYDDPEKGGSSLRMWRDYFQKGQIYGLDYYAKPGVSGDRIRTYQGSQADPLAITPIIVDSSNRYFDIIIDDGSHRNEHVIASFQMLFPYVVEGGWYVIEDTQTSYLPHFGGSTELSAQLTTMGYFKRLADGLNWREIHRPSYTPDYTDLNITGLHFHHNLIFVRKGCNDAESNILRNNRDPNQC